MTKMTEKEMKVANGGGSGFVYYCVCGATFSNNTPFIGDFLGALSYNAHLKYCVEAAEAGIYPA